MKKALGNVVFVVAGVVAFVLARPIGGEISKYFRSSPAVSEANIEDILESPPVGEMYRALKTYYPEDAAYFRSGMLAIAAIGGGSEEEFSKGVALGVEIRRRHAAGLRTAPDQSLGAILQVQTKMIAAFDSDPMLCNRFIMFGSEAISYGDLLKIEGLLDSGSLLFKAMYEGEQSPVKRAQATDEDWGNIILDFLVAGGTDDELDLIVEPDLQNPQLCGAMLRFLRVLIDANFLGADRLRADLVTKINEG
jgi:hypothetical protein